MALFNYTAITADGKAQKGSVTAENAVTARRKLRDQRLTVTTLDEAVGSGSRGLPTVTMVLLEEFSQEMALRLGAGLSAAKALGGIARGPVQRPLSRMAKHLEEGVGQGVALSAALAAYGRHMPTWFPPVIKAGETSGELSAVFRSMAANLAETLTFRRKSMAALAYPAVVLAVGAVTSVFLMVTVVPSLLGLFQRMAIPLPLPTKMLIAAFTHQKEVAFAAVLALALAYGGYRMLRHSAGQVGVEALLFRIPLYGSIMRDTEMSQGIRLLALLISSKVPGVEALKTVAEASRTSTYKGLWLEAAQLVNTGHPLSDTLRGPAFPEILADLTAAGEETGALGESLTRAADVTSERLSLRLQWVMTLAEPLAIVLTGVIVGFLVGALLLPLFQMSAAVR